MPQTHFLCFAAILLPAVVLADFGDFGWVDPPDTADQIRSYGYPAESHYVTTEDGFVLKMFRIPRGKKMTTTNKPLLLQHGILCSSDCWTLSGSDHGLAFILADSGYDVWIGNNRGTTYSMSHMTIPSDDPKLWDFGIHEMGLYDLPAMIDYILEATNEESISYVGHSQGTTIFYIMASMLPEYQSKIRVASSLAPVAFLDNTIGLVKTLSTLSSVLVWVAKSAGYPSLLHNNYVIRAVGEIVCKDSFVLGNLCKTIMFQLAGADNHLSNDTLASHVTRYCPAGASLKQLEHFIQLTQNGKHMMVYSVVEPTVRSTWVLPAWRNQASKKSPAIRLAKDPPIVKHGGHFNRFDHGPVENLVKYGSITPPSYPLENIKVPMLLYYSENDKIATVPEVLRLAKSLKNVKSQTMINYKEFNHLDFMWAINATKLLYNPAINEMVTFR